MVRGSNVSEERKKNNYYKNKQSKTKIKSSAFSEVYI
jgi:hypothetical protein